MQNQALPASSSGLGGMGSCSEGKTNKQLSCLQSTTHHIFHALWASPAAASCLKKYLAQIEHLLDMMEK